MGLSLRNSDLVPSTSAWDTVRRSKNDNLESYYRSLKAQASWPKSGALSESKRVIAGFFMTIK